MGGVLTSCLPESELIIVRPVRAVKHERSTARNGLHLVFCGFEVHELQKSCGKGVTGPVKPDARPRWILHHCKAVVFRREEIER